MSDDALLQDDDEEEDDNEPRSWRRWRSPHARTWTTSACTFYLQDRLWHHTLELDLISGADVSYERVLQQNFFNFLKYRNVFFFLGDMCKIITFLMPFSLNLTWIRLCWKNMKTTIGSCACVNILCISFIHFVWLLCFSLPGLIWIVKKKMC